MNRSLTAILLIGIVLLFACNEAPDPPLLSGPFLGQTPPGDVAELFAPGIISTGLSVRDIAMTPDGDALYFGVMSGPFVAIAETRLVNGQWTRPEIAPFSADSRFFDLEPHISPDGSRFFFLSTRLEDNREPAPEEIASWANQDIWVMDRVENGWGSPYSIGPPVNSDAPEYFPSTTLDGTMYFTREDPDTRRSDIYRSRMVDGQYQEPERLPDQVNSTVGQYNAFIAPDESYLIVCTASRPDSKGSADYYIIFRNEDDTWQEPMNMGDQVNSRYAEYSPYVSPDGRYFFFMSTRQMPDADRPASISLSFLESLHGQSQNGNSDIYWINAAFIDGLREEAPGR